MTTNTRRPWQQQTGLTALRPSITDEVRREQAKLAALAPYLPVKPNNMLVSAEGRLTAVIDFEKCGVGDPACDLFPAWYLLPANVRDEFRAALDVDDATWLRGRGRALPQALGYLRHYRNTNLALAYYARHVIGEVGRRGQGLRR